MCETKYYQGMRQELSKNGNKKRIKQLQSWLSNELKFGKGHDRIKKNGQYIKIKK